jgi:hypothetical protein
MTLPPLQKKLIEQIKINPKLSNSQYADLIGTTKGTVATIVLRLRKIGVIGKYEGKPGGNSNGLELLDFTEDYAGVIAECEVAGIPAEAVNHGWYKGKQWSLHFKGQQKGYFEIRDEIVADMQSHAPDYKPKKYAVVKDGHLLVVDPADIHVGKLCRAIETGEDYNEQIAVQRVREGVNGILNKASGFNIDKILLIIGNDILHVDTPKSTTTSGTFQDSSVTWYDAFTAAKKIYIETIETLMQIAPVHIQYDPSNHDYTNGFFLADTIYSWFSKCDNVTFNVTPAHRKYTRYFNNLIGSTHGDGAKEQDLPLLMAHEAADSWGQCKHKYIYKHHLHHKTSKDYMGVCVETLRSASGTDSWHHRNGYQHAPKAIEGFIHHKEHGQIARLTHIF